MLVFIFGRDEEVKSYESKIREYQWIDLKMSIRKKVDISDRKCLFFLCCVIILGIVFICLYFEYLKQIPLNIFTIITFWWVLANCIWLTIYNLASIIYTQHSPITAADFLKKGKSYNLYLRSFSRDDKKYNYNGGGGIIYHSSNEKDEILIRELLKLNISPKDISRILSTKGNFTLYDCWFSEERLAKVIKDDKVVFCSIGDPDKLLTSKAKSVKLYASQATWQRDIVNLCTHAKTIFVLISDSPGCIWELSNLNPFIEKICFIVDDANMYNSIRKLNLPFDLPLISEDKLQRVVNNNCCYLPLFCVITYKDGHPQLKYIENTKHGYKVFKAYLSQLLK